VRHILWASIDLSLLKAIHTRSYCVGKCTKYLHLRLLSDGYVNPKK